MGSVAVTAVRLITIRSPPFDLPYLAEMDEE